MHIICIINAYSIVNAAEFLNILESFFISDDFHNLNIKFIYLFLTCVNALKQYILFFS